MWEAGPSCRAAEGLRGGRVLVDGEDIGPLPPARRGVGFVFHQGALWPHMTAREHVAFGLRQMELDAAEADRRVGVVLTATMFGMALGGWMSGAVFDLMGSYDAAFLNGFAWNVLNVSIVLLLLHRVRRQRVLRPGLASG